MRTNLTQRLARVIRTSRCIFSLLTCAVFVACAAPATRTPAVIPLATASIAPIVSPAASATFAPTFMLALTPTRARATVTPSAVPAATATSAPPAPTAVDLAPGVISYETAITIDAYPYEKFWIEKRDSASNIVFSAFDHAAYQAAAPNLKPEPKTFRALVLENEYLKVVVLPELGGRIYQITHKQSGKDFLYDNRVLKPTQWGMPEQSGWLAAGGIEWAFPTQEHGLEWNAVWDARVERDAQGVSIVLTDSRAADRPRAQVRVTLPARAAYIAVSPRIENPTAQSQRIQFWSNMALNLGAPDLLAPETRFYLPDDRVFVHSTANEWIPREFIPSDSAVAPAAPIAFSNLAGRDLRVYQNWDNYLGVFVANSAEGDLAQAFVGAYNHATQMGMARVFAPQLTPGVKLFAFGPNFCCRDIFTDGGGEYFELWGGLTRSFFADDDLILAPDETRAWTEYFLPLPDTHGIGAALPDFEMSLTRDGARVTVNAYAAAPRQGVLLLKHGDRELQRWELALDPTRHMQAQFETAERPLSLLLQDREGNILLERELAQ